jgi:hypothetical protein
MSEKILVIGTSHFPRVGPALTHPYLVALPVNTSSVADRQ